MARVSYSLQVAQEGLTYSIDITGILHTDGRLNALPLDGTCGFEWNQFTLKGISPYYTELGTNTNVHENKPSPRCPLITELYYLLS